MVGTMIPVQDVKVGDVLGYGPYLVRVNDLIDGPTMVTIIGDIVNDPAPRGTVLREVRGHKVERITAS